MANRELDERIAVEVMGLIPYEDQALGYGWHSPDWHTLYYRFENDLPAYSADMGTAWQVVEAMIDPDGPHAAYDWSMGMEYSSTVDFVVDFTPRRNHPQARNYPAFRASSAYPAEAICRAALEAVKSTYPRP